MKTEKRNVLLSMALAALLLVGAGCADTDDGAKLSGGAPVNGGAESIQAEDKGETMESAKEDAEEESEEGEDDDAAKPAAGTAAGTMAAAGDVKVFKIVGNKFTFAPSEIRVKMGDKVRLEVSSDDDDHGIAIPAFNVNVKFAPGKPAVAEFVADKKGSYPFFCSVFCGSGHRDMKGTLIVE